MWLSEALNIWIMCDCNFCHSSTSFWSLCWRMKLLMEALRAVALCCLFFFPAVCLLRLLPTAEWFCTVEQEYSGLGRESLVERQPKVVVTYILYSENQTLIYNTKNKPTSFKKTALCFWGKHWSENKQVLFFSVQQELTYFFFATVYFAGSGYYPSRELSMVQ